MTVRAGFEKLHRFLTAPTGLKEDPYWRTLTERIHRARAMHAPTRALEQARTDYLHSLLRKGVKS